MLEEFERSVKATLYDRLASPLIGSYVTAWCIFNYKIILIIFSDLQYTQKSEYIDALFAPWWNYPVRYGFPLLWSAFYVFCYPAIAKFVFRKWQKYIKDKRDIKHEIEGTRLLTLAESEEIRTKYLQSENKIAELMQNSENELKEWKDRCNLLLNEKQQFKERLEKYEPMPVVLTDEVKDEDPEISVEAYDILKKIVDSGSVNISHFRSQMRNSLFVGEVEIPLDDRADMYISELINEGFIASSTKDHYVLQTSGVNYVKKYEKYSNLNKRVNNLESTLSWGGMDALPQEAVDLLKRIVAIKENVFQVMRFDQGDFLFFGDQGKILLKSNEDVLLDELVERSLLKALPDKKYMVTEAGYNFINNPEQQNNTYP